MKQAYIELRGVTKNFGHVRANDGADLSIHRGEIHALLGENGSGKTTLMNILTGIYAPDSGGVYVDGRQLFFRTPADSLKAGIGMIHQHAGLVDAMSVEENIVAGTKDSLWLNKNQLRAQIGEIAQKYRFSVPLTKKVYLLSVAERQAVEILKTFYRGASTLILDEPTPVLTPPEIETLFSNIREMRESGCAVVLITHKMSEVFEISDRVTVLRRGRSVFSAFTKDTSQMELTLKMVGQAVSMHIPRPVKPPSQPAEKEPPLLEVRNIVVKDARGRPLLDGVSLKVDSREIHGIAGVTGNGQRELCDAVAGLVKVSSGEILLNGRDIRGLGPRRLSGMGVKIGYVPEDRMEMGLVGTMSISENVMLRNMHDGRRFGEVFFDYNLAGEQAARIIKKYDVSAPGVYEPVKNLSGGNIQKVLLGREIEMKPQLLITACPVRGLDIGASDCVFRFLNQEKERGLGILFVEEDLDVLLGFCDRVSVMRSGKLVATLDARSASKTDVGVFMTTDEHGERAG
jgi:simple sugar transport system ATP-binding protein